MLHCNRESKGASVICNTRRDTTVMVRRMPKLQLHKLAQINRTGTALFGSGSRVFALGSQFIIVLLLTRLFEKAEFGNFIVVFAAYRVIATGVGTGLASVLLYHVSRSEDHAAAEVRLHRMALLIGFVIAIVVSVGAWAAAGPIALETAKPGVEIWLKGMIPFLVFTLLSTLTTGSYEGRGQVAVAILLTEVAPNFLRLFFLCMLFVIHLPNIWVAHIMAASAALPWLLSVRHLFNRSIHGMQAFTTWDCAYAAKLTLYNFAAMQVQGVDMIVAGWMFPAVKVADYAIASRIAALFPFFLQLRVRMFGPVAGKLLGAGHKEELQREVLIAKHFAIISVTLSVAGLLLASPIFLKLFWKSGSLPVMLVMMAFPAVYRALFAAGDRVLQLAGHANWNVCIMLTALSIVVGIPVAFSGTLGILSLPIAMVVSGFLLNPVIAFAVRRTVGIRLLSLGDIVIAVTAALSVILPLVFFQGAALMFSSGCMFLLLSAALVWRNRANWKRA
jgi:O-antigen/teichoic acid export membrane protein